MHYERAGLLQLLLRSTILSFYVCHVPQWRAGDSPRKQSKWRKKCTLISSPQSRRARQGRWGKFITVKERQKCDPLAPTLPPPAFPLPRVLSRWGKTPAARLRHLLLLRGWWAQWAMILYAWRVNQWGVARFSWSFWHQLFQPQSTFFDTEKGPDKEVGIHTKSWLHWYTSSITSIFSAALVQDWPTNHWDRRLLTVNHRLFAEANEHTVVSCTPPFQLPMLKVDSWYVVSTLHLWSAEYCCLTAQQKGISWLA